MLLRDPDRPMHRMCECGHAQRRLARGELSGGCQQGVGDWLRRATGHASGHGGIVRLLRHHCEVLLHRLKLPDRAPKLLSVVGVLHAERQHTVHRAGQACRLDGVGEVFAAHIGARNAKTHTRFILPPQTRRCVGPPMTGLFAGLGNGQKQPFITMRQQHERGELCTRRQRAAKRLAIRLRKRDARAIIIPIRCAQQRSCNHGVAQRMRQAAARGNGHQCTGLREGKTRPALVGRDQRITKTQCVHLAPQQRGIPRTALDRLNALVAAQLVKGTLEMFNQSVV